MTRLDLMTCGRDRTTYPDDVRQLQAAVPEIRHLSAATVEHLYRAYSDTFWAAGWYGPSDETMAEFRGWLLADVGGDP